MPSRRDILSPPSVRLRRGRPTSPLVDRALHMSGIVQPPYGTQERRGVQSFLPSMIPNFGFGLGLWLRSDMGITIGTGVSAWADQGPGGNDATQGTGTKQPTYIASDPKFRGRPSLSFDGGDIMAIADAAALRANTETGITVYCVHYPENVGGSNPVLSKADGTTTEWFWRNRWSNGDHDFHGIVQQADNLGTHATSGSGDVKGNGLNIFRFAWEEDGADSHFQRQEGGEGTSVVGGAGGQGAYDATAGTPSDLYLGAFGNESAYFTGRIAEIVIVNGYVEPGSELDTKIFTYMEERYAWDPSMLGDALEMWLRADMGITLNGSDVSNWADQSGKDHDAAQLTAGNQPVYTAVNADFYDRPTVDFHLAQNEVLVVPHATALGNDQDKEILMIMSHPSDAGNREFLSKFDSPDFEWGVRKDTIDNAESFLRDADNNSNALVSDTATVLDDVTEPHLVRARFDVSACEAGVSVDSGTLQTATDTAPAVDQMAGDLGIGARADGSQPSDVKTAEIVITNDFWSADRLETARACYFARRYQQYFGG